MATPEHSSCRLWLITIEGPSGFIQSLQNSLHLCVYWVCGEHTATRRGSCLRVTVQGCLLPWHGSSSEQGCTRGWVKVTNGRQRAIQLVLACRATCLLGLFSLLLCVGFVLCLRGEQSRSPDSRMQRVLRTSLPVAAAREQSPGSLQT